MIPSDAFNLPDVTRLTIVTDDGVILEDYNLYENGVTILIQDQGRTLKVIPQFNC